MNFDHHRSEFVFAILRLGEIMSEGTVYVLARGDVEFARCPSEVGLLREEILDRTERGQITEDNKREWLVYAVDYPSGNRRPLSLTERARLFP